VTDSNTTAAAAESSTRQGLAATQPAPSRPSLVANEDFLLRRFAQTRDPRLKEELVERFLPLARSLALRYRGASEQLEDLIQVASLGLVKALDGFDPQRGPSFIAYAAPTILGELRRHFRDRVGEVRLPRSLQERTMAVSQAAQELSDEEGRTPTVAQIAARLELTEEEISEALQADEARRTLSLDVPQSRDDRESAPLVESVGAPEPGYDTVEAQLAAAEAPLDDRERTVLRLRFEEDLNQYEIGRRLGVSQMQISRIMRRALRKLLEAVQGEEATASGGEASRGSDSVSTT
jgi:RNA polymerase sigma-B factor